MVMEKITKLFPTYLMNPANRETFHPETFAIYGIWFRLCNPLLNFWIHLCCWTAMNDDMHFVHMEFYSRFHLHDCLQGQFKRFHWVVSKQFIVADFCSARMVGSLRRVEVLFKSRHTVVSCSSRHGVPITLWEYRQKEESCDLHTHMQHCDVRSE